MHHAKTKSLTRSIDHEIANQQVCAQTSWMCMHPSSWISKRSVYIRDVHFPFLCYFHLFYPADFKSTHVLWLSDNNIPSDSAPFWCYKHPLECWRHHWMHAHLYLPTQAPFPPFFDPCIQNVSCLASMFFTSSMCHMYNACNAYNKRSFITHNRLLEQM